MMTQPSDSTVKVTEKTFSSYNPEQSKAYAQIRRDYHPNVYQTIIDHHTATGGQLDTAIDVGCGPGNVTRSIATHFSHAIGLDPGQSMVATAQSLTPPSPSISFEISSAEELGRNLSPPIADSSIDLITAGNAAHWFDMAGFWKSAARVLKPGGSVALWTSGEIRAHPDMPNAAAIQKAMDDNNEKYLMPYMEPGSLLTRNQYRTLPLPWTLEHPVVEFDQATFVRKDWDPQEPFFTGPSEVDLDTLEKMFFTSSARTRWRQAHPEAVGTEQDVTRILRRELERLLHEAGVEKGKEILKGTVHGAIIIVKKKA